MSYIQRKGKHQFLKLGRSTTASLSVGGSYAYQTIQTTGNQTLPVAVVGSLVFGNTVTTAVGYPPVLEQTVSGTVGYAAADMAPAQGASANGCEVSCGIGNGSTLAISIPAGYEVNETLLTESFAWVIL